MATGRIDLARSGAADLAAGDPDLYGRVVPAWEGDLEAWAALKLLAASRPLHADTLGWCALIAGRLGDDDAARRCGRMTQISLSPAALPPFAKVTTGRARTLPPSVFDDYTLLYRRPMPADLIVDGLPKVTWQAEP